MSQGHRDSQSFFVITRRVMLLSFVKPSASVSFRAVPWFNCFFQVCASEVGYSWVKVPPVELDGSRPKRSVREEAVRPNPKRDADWNGRVVTKVNLIQ